MRRTSAVDEPTWTAGALLHSGRPDPTWVLRGSATPLVRRFVRLEPFGGAKPDQARLGYRGAWLRAPDGRRWLAYGGVAWCEGTDDIRADRDRKFERALLATAAPGLLPKELSEQR